MDDDEHTALLISGWRSRTGTLHIRRDCKAVTYQRQHMNPVLVRFDVEDELDQVFNRGPLCRYCFPGGERVKIERVHPHDH